MPGRYGTKTVVCGAPNCRPGILTVYVPLGVKTISGVESDGMLASAAELGINRDHAGIIELRDGDAAALARQRDRDRQQEHHAPARSLGPSRHGARSGGDHRQDAARSGAGSDLLPGAPVRAGEREIEIEDLRALPALQRAGFRERDRAAVAALAAVPADGGRPEPDQQHRRSDELHHGRTGAADARVRSRQTERRHHLRASGARRRANRRAERRRVRARAVESGDRRRGRPHRDRRRDRRTRQRDLRHDHFHRSRKREFQRCQRAQDFRRAEAAHRRFDAIRKSAGPAQHRPRSGARPRTAAAALAGHPAGGRPGRPCRESARTRAASPLDLDWLARKLGRVLDADEVRRILESLQFGVSRERLRENFLGHGPSGARPKTSPCRKIWWKKWAA